MRNPRKPKILVVDDHETVRQLYASYLKQDYAVTLAANGETGLQNSQQNRFDLYIVDLLMPGMDGIQFIKKLREIHPAARIIVVSQTEELDLVIGAFREHTLDFLRKPVKKKYLLHVIERNIRESEIKSGLDALSEESGKDANCPEPVIGSGGEVNIFWEEVKRIAISKFSATISITGESGSGKEVVARQIHKWSSRQNKPFIAVNCGLLSHQLAASELFGIEKGVATGVDPRPGKFQIAHGGTLLLDEVGEVPLEVQSFLLRTLQDGIVVPVGGHHEIFVDVRVIAASNRDLTLMVKNGTFREDLYYRLSSITLRVPSLRTHPHDIPDLLKHFYQRHGGSGPLPLSSSEMKEWQAYNWPGNIRQLENALLTRLITEKALDTSSMSVPEILEHSSLDKLVKNRNWDEIKSDIFKHALESSDGNVRQAAKALGIPKTTFWDYCRRFHLIS